MDQQSNSTTDHTPFDQHSHAPKGSFPMKRRFLALIAACLIVLGGLGGLAVSAGSTPSSTAAAQTTTRPPSNARSGPAAGGAAGTVASVSKSSFIVSTSAGLKVTVNEVSSTTYQKGTTKLSASAITTGKRVLVLGTTNGGTVTARQVIVSWQPTRSSSAAGVIPFQRGAPTTSKSVGQIPANYSQGSGTIVSGTTANKATKAALAAYPGGVVDRVVKLSNGEYEVHTIGVSWPHHVFVNQQFKVVGAN
jgi:hypothetical protein